MNQGSNHGVVEKKQIARPENNFAREFPYIATLCPDFPESRGVASLCYSIAMGGLEMCSSGQCTYYPRLQTKRVRDATEYGEYGRNTV